MADTSLAIQFVVRQEDSTLSGVITDTPGDLGGTTRFGITAASAPNLVTDGFFEKSMPAASALPIAEGWYAEKYANPLLIAEINNQAVATALLSFAINQEDSGGHGTAVRLIQQACSITADGTIGSQTVAVINAQVPAILLANYCNAQIKHYEAIVAANPSQQKFLRGWLNRVKAVAEQPV